jgi:hypothetical protein
MRRREIMACAALLVLALAGAVTWGALHLAHRGQTVLTVDDVLAWRWVYDSLIGKQEELAIERFGQPNRKFSNGMVYRANPKTGFREVVIFLEGGTVSGSPPAAVAESEEDSVLAEIHQPSKQNAEAPEERKISGVKIFAGPQDVLAIEQLVQKASIFCFSAGTFQDSTEQYFEAQSLDGRNTLQFAIDGHPARFRAAIFVKEGRRCDPSNVASAEN